MVNNEIKILINGVTIPSLCLAIGLLQEEIPIKLIDKRDDMPEQEGEEELFIIYPETQSFLKKIDVWYAIEEYVQPISYVNFFAKNSDAYAYQLNLEKEVTSSVSIPYNTLLKTLHEQLEDYDFAVDRSINLIDYKNKKKFNLCTLESAGEKSLLQTQYIIAADENDGVTHSAWLKKEKGDYTINQLIALSTLTISPEAEQEEDAKNQDAITIQNKSVQADDINIFSHKKATCSLLPYKEKYSIVVEFEQSSTKEEAEEFANELLSIAATRLWLIATPVESRIHKTNQQFSHTPMQQNNVFFIGQSVNVYANIHQTINQGVADAENIIRRIILAEEEKWTRKLLHTYGKEREISHSEDHLHDQKIIAALYHPTLIGGVSSLKKTLHQKNVRQSIFYRYQGTYDQYPESPECVEEYPSLWAMAPWNKTTDVTWADGFSFFSWPKAGYQAPDGYLVFESNEPKQNRKELLTNTRHVLLVFDGIKTKDTSHIDQIIEEVQTRYDQFLDCYRVTTSYDITKHDGDASVFGDADSLLHKTYNAKRSSFYLIRPDGVIAFRSIGLLKEKLDTYIQSLWVPPHHVEK